MKKTNKLFANLLLGANLLFSAGFNSQVLANPVTKMLSFDTYVTKLDNGNKIKYKTNGRNNLHILDCTNKKVTKEMMQAIINYFHRGIDFLAVETLEFEENIILDEKVYEIREVGEYISNENYKEKHYEETKPKRTRETEYIRGKRGKKESSYKRWTQDDIERLRAEFNNRYVVRGTWKNGIDAISRELAGSKFFSNRSANAISSAIHTYCKF